jgi:hypothetical protein
MTSMMNAGDLVCTHDDSVYAMKELQGDDLRNPETWTASTHEADQRPVLYLKGQSQGCWSPPLTGGGMRESFEEYCQYVERIVERHGVRRVVWDGDPPESQTFAEFFPELFRRLSALRLPDDRARPAIEEIKAFRLRGTTEELKEMMGAAFVDRGLGPMHMTVHLQSGAAPRPYAVPGEGDPVRISVEESNVPDEGRNPYIALGWYSLTEDLPSLRGGEAAAVSDSAQESSSTAPKVVVCLGGGATCNLEFERACSEQVESLWYCLYLPPRLRQPDAAADPEPQLQSSINAAHAAEAFGDVPLDEWRFGGRLYQTCHSR